MTDVPWWLYLLECKGGSIYTGIALDVDARYRMHCAGKGAAYTRANPPVRVLASMEFPSRRLAARAECEMKRRPAAKKWQWVAAVTTGERLVPCDRVLDQNPQEA